MKKIIVDDEKCIGCGACVAIDSEHFDFNEDGLSEAISQENLESENLQNAISSCPVNALVKIVTVMIATAMMKDVTAKNVTKKDNPWGYFLISIKFFYLFN